MADSDINGLPQAQSDYVDATDELIIQKAGETLVKKIQVDDLFGGWRDIFPIQFETGSGPSAPTWTALTANCYAWAFGVNDEMWLTFHTDHDIKQSATMYQHVHWTTSGTNVQPVRWEITTISAAGHGAGVFGAETVLNLDGTPSGVALTHEVTEDATGIATTLPDNMLIERIKRVTNGGTDNTDTVFFLTADIHYPTQMFSTKNRNPNFYT